MFLTGFTASLWQGCSHIRRPMFRSPTKPLTVAVVRSESTCLVRSRWEPCLGTGVPLLVALNAPQFRLDEAGNAMAVTPIGGSTVTPGDATSFAEHASTAGGGGAGGLHSRVAATHTQAPRCVTEPSGLRLDPLSTATLAHGDSATPRKRCLAPRALLPSPVSVTDGLAPMLAPPMVCEREGADALSVVMKLAEAVRPPPPPS